MSAAKMIVVSEEDLRALIRDAVRAEVGDRGPSAGEPEVMTREQAAKMLQVHPNVVVRYVKELGLPASKVGPEWRFRRSEILRWLAERPAKPVRLAKGAR